MSKITNVYNGSSFQTPVFHLQLHQWSLVVSPSWDFPFPFKWVQEKVVLECEQPLDQAWVM